MYGLTRGRKARFYLSVSAVYAQTLLFAVSIFDLHRARPVIANAYPVTPVVLTKAIIVTEGKPVRLVIPRLAIDLPIDPGIYDSANNTWTLSGYHAQYALSSVVANDYEGNTLIYGHNNCYVFCKLKFLQPGDGLQVYTDNGHEFSYSYQGSADFKPDDLSIFKLSGPPTVTLQTCTGNWNEIRRMYEFKFEKVVQ
jgi:LPXTG-site transpeptidase (sortase) family protein